MHPAAKTDVGFRKIFAHDIELTRSLIDAFVPRG